MFIDFQTILGAFLFLETLFRFVFVVVRICTQRHLSLALLSEWRLLERTPRELRRPLPRFAAKADP